MNAEGQLRRSILVRTDFMYLTHSVFESLSKAQVHNTYLDLCYDKAEDRNSAQSMHNKT
jgi:hypothetical protein